MPTIKTTRKKKNCLNDFNPIESDIAMMDTNGTNNPMSPNKVFTKFCFKEKLTTYRNGIGSPMSPNNNVVIKFF
jgi:hypothetical protein